MELLEIRVAEETVKGTYRFSPDECRDILKCYTRTEDEYEHLKFEIECKEDELSTVENLLEDFIKETEEIFVTFYKWSEDPNGDKQIVESCMSLLNLFNHVKKVFLKKQRLNRLHEFDNLSQWIRDSEIFESVPLNQRQIEVKVDKFLKDW